MGSIDSHRTALSDVFFNLLAADETHVLTHLFFADMQQLDSFDKRVAEVVIKLVDNLVALAFGLLRERSVDICFDDTAAVARHAVNHKTETVANDIKCAERQMRQSVEERIQWRINYFFNNFIHGNLPIIVSSEPFALTS